MAYITTKTPIKTNRYIYHVSNHMHRASIMAHGLQLSKQCLRGNQPALFANNSNQRIPSLQWYPFVFDFFFVVENYPYNYDKVWDEDHAHFLGTLGCDFWQIDTHKIKNKWFVDWVAAEDFSHNTYGMNRKQYVYTLEPVPFYAIKLMAYKRKKLYELR